MRVFTLGLVAWLAFILGDLVASVGKVPTDNGPFTWGLVISGIGFFGITAILAFLAGRESQL